MLLERVSLSGPFASFSRFAEVLIVVENSVMPRAGYCDPVHSWHDNVTRVLTPLAVVLACACHRIF